MSEDVKRNKISGTDIILADVSFSYDDKAILKNADVIIDCSKINIIKGANGIGKSTLFKLITGLLQCKTGTITVGNVTPETICEEEFSKSIFYLPQRNADFNLTAYELYSILIPDKAKNAIQCCLDFGLTNQLISEAKIKNLSGGERKKVFLSLAFTLEPSILLLDEPTNSLDAYGKKVLCEKLEARKSGAVIITHDDIFKDIAERVYTVSNGGIFRE